jgi:hypothetical protein
VTAGIWGSRSTIGRGDMAHVPSSMELINLIVQVTWNYLKELVDSLSPETLFVSRRDGRAYWSCPSRRRR